MEYVKVVFPDRREVLIDGRSQGYNRNQEGRLRALRVNEGVHTIALGGGGLPAAIGGDRCDGDQFRIPHGNKV